MQNSKLIAKISDKTVRKAPAFIPASLLSLYLLMQESVFLTESDPDWLARFHAGEDAIFQQLHQSHGPNVIAFLASGGTEANLCCDLAQKAWVKAFTCRHQFKGGNFGAWFYRLAKNQRIDESRRRRQVEMPEHLDVPDLETNQDASEEDRLAALADCWGSLPSELSATLRAHYFDELKYQEISVSLEISAGTVASRISRAKLSLKSCIEGKLV